MEKEQKPTQVQTYITGKDLRIMRIHSKLTTREMAAILNVKSRKTIENWEQQASAPDINQFFIYCCSAGFNPSLVIQEVIRRNEEDATQQKYFNMEACLLRKIQ